MQEAFYTLVKEAARPGRGGLFFHPTTWPKWRRSATGVAIIKSGRIMACETLEKLRQKRFRRLELTLANPLEDLQIPNAQALLKKGEPPCFFNPWRPGTDPRSGFAPSGNGCDPAPAGSRRGLHGILPKGRKWVKPPMPGILWRSHFAMLAFSSAVVAALEYLIVWLISTLDFAPAVATAFAQLPPIIRTFFNEEFLTRLSIRGGRGLRLRPSPAHGHPGLKRHRHPTPGRFPGKSNPGRLKFSWPIPSDGPLSGSASGCRALPCSS